MLLKHNSTVARGGLLLERNMLVQKGHKILLQPNNEQIGAFRRWCGVHRWAYNYGLERKIEAYEETGKSPGGYTLMKEVVQLKRTAEYAWLGDVPKSVPRVALLHLDAAYQNFFRRVKSGETPGFPKFKSRKRSKMVFHLESDTVRVAGRYVRLPKLGWVKMSKPLRFEGKLVGSVAVGEYAGKWYASFNVEVEVAPAESQGRAVGVDLGVKDLATLSDGTVYEAPKALRKAEKLLARAQRQLARKQKGSNRWRKAMLRVQRIHKRIRDIRTDAIHQATAQVVAQYNLVALEDLNTSGMMRNHHLAKSIADASIREFRQQVEYKESWRAGKVAVIDRWFPSSKRCSVCGCINDNLTLADRVWTCDCGVVHQRDVNAAANILAEALRTRTVQTGLRVEG